MSLERRLRRLESEHAGPQETDAEREERRNRLRADAEHANRCRDHDELPIFEITEGGAVLCARDGKPVTDPR